MQRRGGHARTESAGIKAQDPPQGVVTALGSRRDGWSMVEHLLRASGQKRFRHTLRLQGPRLQEDRTTGN